MIWLSASGAMRTRLGRLLLRSGASAIVSGRKKSSQQALSAWVRRKLAATRGRVPRGPARPRCAVPPGFRRIGPAPNPVPKRPASTLDPPVPQPGLSGPAAQRSIPDLLVIAAGQGRILIGSNPPRYRRRCPAQQRARGDQSMATQADLRHTRVNSANTSRSDHSLQPRLANLSSTGDLMPEPALAVFAASLLSAIPTTQDLNQTPGTQPEHHHEMSTCHRETALTHRATMFLALTRSGRSYARFHGLAVRRHAVDELGVRYRPQHLGACRVRGLGSPQDKHVLGARELPRDHRAVFAVVGSAR